MPTRKARLERIRSLRPQAAEACRIERTQRDTSEQINIETQNQKSWPGVTAELTRFSPRQEYDFRLNASSDVFSLLNVHRVDGETTACGAPRSLRRNLRDRLTFIPNTCELAGWSRILNPASALTIYFDQSPRSDERPDLSSVPPMLEFEDNMLRSIMLQFQRLLKEPALDTPGYAETLGTLLAFELRRMKSGTTAQMPCLGGLTARQVKLVCELIDTRLDQNITISELSGLLDLSRSHFIRSFKKTVGMPPHQFIMRRRIERAKELLIDERYSVIDIARMSGFGSHANLTSAFRRIVGTTPTAFRRNS